MAEARDFTIALDDVAALGRGCAILGTGGGGSIGASVLMARRAIEEHGPVTVRALSGLADSDVLLPLSGVGAPTVGHEMLARSDDARAIRDEVERAIGRRVSAVMPTEIGGANGVTPVAWALGLGLPLVDADGMGRAFPELQMVSMNVAGRPTETVVLTDVIGNVVTLRPVDGLWSERHVRAISVASGSRALIADYVLTASEARGAVLEGSVATALRVGRAFDGAEDPLDAVQAVLNAQRLITGKIVELDRRTAAGFARGSVVIEGLGDYRGDLVRVEIQNENLIAFRDGKVLASVPDLITVLDSQTGTAIPTEHLRFGQRVSVLAWPCHEIWRTPRGIELAGPRAFGYDLDYVPIEERSNAA